MVSAEGPGGAGGRARVGWGCGSLVELAVAGCRFEGDELSELLQRSFGAVHAC